MNKVSFFFRFLAWLGDAKSLGFLLVLAFSIGGLSCSEESFPDGAFEEKNIDIIGNWQVGKVWRNGDDISSRLNFSNFSLQLNAGSYTVTTGNVPFVVEKNGVWTLDDPVYPQSLQLTPNGGTAATVAFHTPPVSRGSQLNLAFSLGCGSNTYVFELVKN